MGADFCESALVNLEHIAMYIGSGSDSLYRFPLPVFIQNSYNHFPS
jgi:hypothetical protein